MLAPLDSKDRYELLSEWIKAARLNFARIRAIGVTIENHGNGNHLEHWANAIDGFKGKYL